MESTHCSPASITTGKFWIANGLKWEPKNNYLEIYQPDRPTILSISRTTRLKARPGCAWSYWDLWFLHTKQCLQLLAINGFKCAKCNSNMLWMLKGRWRKGNKRVVSISAKLHLHSPSLESNQFQFLPPLQTVTLQRSIQIRHFDYTMKGASTCWHEPHAVPGACRIDKNRFHYLLVPALIIFYAHDCYLSTFSIVKMQTGSGGLTLSLTRSITKYINWR